MVYYDFPAYDSPARIFGSAINLFVTFYLTYDTAADTTLSLESVVSITLQTSNIRNANDFAK